MGWRNFEICIYPLNIKLIFDVFWGNIKNRYFCIGIKMIDNIIIGQLLVNERSLGILPDENTVRFSKNEFLNDQGELFLPVILKSIGLFKSTTHIRQLNKQRLQSKKITDPLSKNLWRIINKPEVTHFKIGKNNFWLFVGE